MTPERIKELRSKYNPEFFAELSRDIPSDVDECLDYIDTLQRDVATYAQRDELVVGSMMVERDDAREEVKRLQSELALLRQPPRCPKCDIEESVSVFYHREWEIRCNCGEHSNAHSTLLAALNAWRKGETK